MHLFLVFSNPRQLRHILGLAEAGKKKGHKVTLFFNEESVKLLQEPSPLRGIKVELLACVTACQVAGITHDNLVPGARMSSLGEMVTLIEDSDRTLFWG